MFDDSVTVPLVVRTPMGGRRGYGPTHSQSLEKLLVGVPGITVVAPSECHALGRAPPDAVADDEPVFFIENKLMYGRPNRRPENGRRRRVLLRRGRRPLPGADLLRQRLRPAVRRRSSPTAACCRRRSTPRRQLILEHEVFTEVVASRTSFCRSISSRCSTRSAARGRCHASRRGRSPAASARRSPPASSRGVARPQRSGASASPHATGSSHRRVNLEDDALPGVEDVIAAVTQLAAWEADAAARDRPHPR